MIALRCARGHP